MMRFPTFDSSLNQSLTLIGDYFRVATVLLAVQRLLKDEIPGRLAEVGVYKGYLSKLIHQTAPDRVFYLFDTFAGFPSQDLEAGAGDDQRFSDTTVEAVLNYIGDERNIVVRKGYVPETMIGLENERFALALLDLDLYPPTKAGLEFFYPRLSPGGYLLVHDYNSPESNWACRRAVDEFMADKPEKIIEIADESGTVLFRKL
jgi:O-methyltransferase